MNDAAAQNPFAPPRAHVEDQSDTPTALVTAKRMSRFLAYLVDASPALVIGLIGGLVVAVMAPGMFRGGFDPSTAGTGIVALLGVFFLVFFVASIAWLIWQIVLLYKYGQTVGKKVLGIRVVRMDGSRVSFARFFFLRWLGMAVIGAVIGGICGALRIPFVGNFLWLLDCVLIFGAAQRCLHDYIADTQVVTAESSPKATLEGTRGY